MNKKRYRDENFSFDNSLEFEKAFNSFDEISFTSCTFSSELELKKDIKLRFDKCTFKDVWKHILCKEVVYSQCTFEKFEYYNIAKEKDISIDSLLFDCTFKDIDCEGITFEKPLIRIIDVNKASHIDSIRLVRCEFKDDFILNVTDSYDRTKLMPIYLTSIDLEDSIFYKKVKIQNIHIVGKSNFFNTSFKDLADFYQTEFNQVDFRRTNFEQISVFAEAIFKKDVDFKYVKFLGKSIFRDTVIEGKLNLRDTIFDDDANFLDVTSKKREKNDDEEFLGAIEEIIVQNRETARVIKNFYDKSNNIIEANRFYALEMKERERENELEIRNKKVRTFKSVTDYIIFKLHGISSSHSQDPVSPFIWIFSISFFYLTLMQINKQDYSSFGLLYYHVANIMSIVITLSLYYKKCEISNICKLLYVGVLQLYFLIFISSCSIESIFNAISDKINPFSIMTSPDTITFDLLLFKIIMAYLIYQFIISVRQNTRRK